MLLNFFTVPLIFFFLLAAQELLKIKASGEPHLLSVVELMRGCSGTDEYAAGKEKDHSILTTKKLDYTTELNYSITCSFSRPNTVILTVVHLKSRSFFCSDKNSSVCF